MSDSANDHTTDQNRKSGRPRNADRPVIPWEEVDRLLVFGETVRDEETGRETVPDIDSNSTSGAPGSGMQLLHLSGSALTDG